MTDSEKKQVEMHRDYHARCQFAINNGLYLEAILMEYAAIEARLETLCSILSMPCGKACKYRKDVKISQRISCLCAFRNKNKEVFETTKLSPNFYSDKGELRNWIRLRDQRVHGLYKDEEKYRVRIEENKIIAENGYEYSKLLYNETRRIRRLKEKHKDKFANVIFDCKSKNCKGNPQKYPKEL